MVSARNGEGEAERWRDPPELRDVEDVNIGEVTKRALEEKV